MKVCVAGDLDVEAPGLLVALLQHLPPHAHILLLPPGGAPPPEHSKHVIETVAAADM